MALTKEEIIKKIGVGGKEEYAEESKDNFQYTGWPKPGKRFKIIWEIWNLSIEETYFWMLNYLTEGWGYVQVEKIYDMFTAAENSSFFGVVLLFVLLFVLFFVSLSFSPRKETRLSLVRALLFLISILDIILVICLFVCLFVCFL